MKAPQSTQSNVQGTASDDTLMGLVWVRRMRTSASVPFYAVAALRAHVGKLADGVGVSFFVFWEASEQRPAPFS